MPRFCRTIVPGTLIHVIFRFVNREFRITDAIERHEYLMRLGQAVTHSDWRMVSYVMMSSHGHLGAVAGNMPFDQVIKGVHSGFAAWLNRRQCRLGPVFADRPKTIAVDTGDAARLIAYHHNNPVRAQVAASADATDWSSHRAYLGLSSAPQWLDVRLGLQLAGFATTQEAARAEFAEYVTRHADDERDSKLSGSTLTEDRKALRQALQVAAEVAYPTWANDALRYRVVVHNRRWRGTLSAIFAVVAQLNQMDIALIRSPNRNRNVVRIRRIAVLAARALGRAQHEIGLYLGISGEAVGYLERNGSELERAQAEAAVAVVLQPTSSDPAAAAPT